MDTIAVAGATGTVGRHVCAALESAGHRVAPLSRADGVDVRSGKGLDAALSGVSAVVDVLNVGTGSASAAREFFGATSATLLAAERSAGVGHHVLLSIVGIDAAPGGYYAGKLRQEELVSAGPVPWTILRATQFHEFAGQVMDRTSFGPLRLVPRARVRPVAACEVGETLARIAAGDPQRVTVSLRGPREESLVGMARQVNRGGLVVPIRMPGAMGKAMRSGALCGDDEAMQGAISFAEWLTEEESRA